MKPKVELPEVGSFWLNRYSDFVVRVCANTEDCIGYTLPCGTNASTGPSDFLSVFKPSLKKFHKINDVWCVAPVDEIQPDGTHLYQLFEAHDIYCHYDGEQSTERKCLSGTCFLSLDDCEAYENALKLGIEK